MKDHGYIPKQLQNAIFGLSIFAIAASKKVHNRAGYSSLFSRLQSQKSSRPKHSILKLFGYKSLFGCGFLPAIGFATSFGSIGAVFPVQERSLLEVIQERLQSHPKVSWQKYITSRINRPTSLGLQRANAKRTYYYDPSIVLTHPILGAEGEVLYQAGTRVNGLLSLPQYAPCWLFFNADDRAQLRWAQKTAQTCQSPKLILTGGALVEASQALKRVIYFDQGGALKNQLHLQAVPAFVKREKERLLITEVKISESGDAI